MHAALRPLAALALLAACAAADGQTVSLQGMLGHQALLIVDGAAPKGVAPGDSWHGVKVLSTSGDEAVLEIGGRRQTLHVGEAPASVGGRGASAGTRIVLTAGTGGHFSTQGAINGQSARMMVDTGATFVAMGVDEAQRLGVDWRRGQQGSMNTANGVTPAWKGQAALAAHRRCRDLRRRRRRDAAAHATGPAGQQLSQPLPDEARQRADGAGTALLARR
jgi:aspartyl protease family protein